MADEGLLIKDQIKKIEKNFISLNKKTAELDEVLEKMVSDYNAITSMKAQSDISPSYFNEVRTQVNKTNVLENVGAANKAVDEFSKRVLATQNKLKEMQDYLEKFRTQRTYKINDTKKIFRFLSAFLEGFSESYNFKPEFIGVVDLNAVAEAVKGTKEGALVKVKYEKIPDLIEFGYKSKLKNFSLESHNLKMTFYKDYVVKINADNDMIKKIDKAAKESNVSFES